MGGALICSSLASRWRLSRLSIPDRMIQKSLILEEVDHHLTEAPVILVDQEEERIVREEAFLQELSSFGSDFL